MKRGEYGPERADYMRQYRREGERRGKTADKVRTMLVQRAHRYVQQQYPTVWETLWWVAWRELQDQNRGARVNDRARKLAIRWLMDVHPRVYNRLLDECWEEMGGKLMSGRPRAESRLVPIPSARGDRRFTAKRRKPV